jgi:hypothetical protein
MKENREKSKSSDFVSFFRERMMLVDGAARVDGVEVGRKAVAQS